jgi:hypothetical protein
MHLINKKYKLFVTFFSAWRIVSRYSNQGDKMSKKNKLFLGAALAGLLLGAKAYSCDSKEHKKDGDTKDHQSKNSCGKMMKKSKKQVTKQNSCGANKCGANSCG